MLITNLVHFDWSRSPFFMINFLYSNKEINNIFIVFALLPLEVW